MVLHKKVFDTFIEEEINDIIGIIILFGIESTGTELTEL